MKYISDDGRVFDTEQEYCKHEQQIRKAKEDERIKKEKLESERKTLMDQICQKCKELSELTQTYYDKFGITMGEYLPFGEFLKILYES